MNCTYCHKKDHDLKNCQKYKQKRARTTHPSYWKIGSQNLRIRTKSGKILGGVMVSHFKTHGEHWLLIRGVRPLTPEF